MIQTCLEKRTNKKVPEVLEVLESLLCFDAWLHQSHYWETTNPAHVANEMKKHQVKMLNDYLDHGMITSPSNDFWEEQYLLENKD